MRCGYNPSYVLDEMDACEINTALKYSYYAHRDAWEQARFISYVMAQTQSTKRLQIEDIMKFTWEKEEDEEQQTPATKEDIERMKAQAQNYVRYKNKKIEKR